MAAFVIIGPLLLIGVLWWLLNRHENRRAGEGKPRHSGLRLFFASAAILVALFTGGCSLFFLGNMDGSYVSLPAVAVIGGIPFVGALLWSLAIMARTPSLFTKLAALVAVFITCFYAVAMSSLSGLTSESSLFVTATVISGIVTAATALWLFRSENPDIPLKS
jgi:hypothetical protein